MTLEQSPTPGDRFTLFCGERLEVRLKLPSSADGSAFLRTNLGNATVRRREIVAAVEENLPRLETDWHDLPMQRVGDNEFLFEATLDEIGVFEAKAFFLENDVETLHWPKGDNITVKVEPASLAAANTIYTAFVRQFGPNKREGALGPDEEETARQLESKGCTVIPRSGKFRDFIQELDFIIGDMGFRIIQFLPIHPTPTTYARMGRFGSPFAALDFMNVDRSLAEFDGHTTPLEQFMEVIREVHARDGLVVMDIALNHTGWASQLQIHHPEWFPRNEDGSFKSPGAWGVVWADLTELDYSHVSLWRYVADIFLYWCEKGANGFRCDAGYMLPFPVWEYIVAKVRQVYPETIFLLEGLGGKISTTEMLIGEAGLNWAYSELFQNYSRDEIEEYLPTSLEIESRSGLLVNYAETHDNNRLAATSRNFAQMRTGVCALGSQCGAFGITNGVEWLAEKKVDVHGAPSLNWGAADNLVDWLRSLNTVICYHPAFQHGSRREMIQNAGGNSLALLRQAAETGDCALILANLSHDQAEPVHFEMPPELQGGELFDLLGNEPLHLNDANGRINHDLQPGEVRCLVAGRWDVEGYSKLRRFDRALAHWRFRAKYAEIKKSIRGEISPLGPITDSEVSSFIDNPLDALQSLNPKKGPMYVPYKLPEDLRRKVMVPPHMLLVIESPQAFMLIEKCDGTPCYTDHSLCAGSARHLAVIPPARTLEQSQTREIEFHMYTEGGTGPGIATSTILRLAPYPSANVQTAWSKDSLDDETMCGLLTNKHSSICYPRMAWSQIHSQYDCLLAVNPADAFPADRRILWTRCRCWVVYKDYSRDVDVRNLQQFEVRPGGPIMWRFILPIGRGYALPLRIELDMAPEKDRARLTFQRESKMDGDEYPLLEPREKVNLIVRPDIEDRNFHTKTKAYMGPEEAFPAATEIEESGFRFRPHEIELRLNGPGSRFVEETEWQYMIDHPIDGERGLDAASDLFSPGYFEFELEGGGEVEITGECLLEREALPETDGIERASDELETQKESGQTSVEAAAESAVRDFIVRRNNGFTVIAGYPWFLDWGRDTLIALRGIIALGWHEMGLRILKEFARFEDRGTIPNMIHGEDASNRDTSDAPLWFFIACRDLVESSGDENILKADCDGRSLLEVLVSIAENYCTGTPKGVGVDRSTGLVYSPEHFTWMDTQYPAGTPRAGYPIEIQALWSAALGFLAASFDRDGKKWTDMQQRVNKSIERLYVRSDGEGLADCLHAPRPLASGEDCVADDHCRPNQLLAVTLGDILSREDAIAVVESCWRLLVPGAIRSMADEQVQFELPVRDPAGNLLNDPKRPYQRHYRGDEDSSRKPAYHNGTAWIWQFPSFCEALVAVYGAEMADTALALLGSVSELFNSGCAGHLPEIVDGDAPHRQRGCSAQAWSATEVARVVKLNRKGPIETVEK